MKARDAKGPSSDGDGDGLPLVAHALRADGFDASEDGTGRGTPLVAVDLKQIMSKANRSTPGPVSPTLHQEGTVYAIRTAQTSANGHGVSADAAYTLDGANGQAVAFQESQSGFRSGYAVRRLTPRECERLQGFPDDYTRIPLRNKNGRQNGKWAKDGPRYKALGNSMAVNCMRWLGSRIALVEASVGARAAAPERVA